MQALKKPFTFDASLLCPTQNIMDKWILAYTQSLIKFVHVEMKGLRLCKSLFLMALIFIKQHIVCTPWCRGC